MERRCQEGIDGCCATGEANPILLIHDVGAGGLSNALPELIGDAKSGGRIRLRDVLNADLGMSPLEIWCNEAQERYVLGIEQSQLEQFAALCERDAKIHQFSMFCKIQNEFIIIKKLSLTHDADR